MSQRTFVETSEVGWQVHSANYWAQQHPAYWCEGLGGQVWAEQVRGRQEEAGPVGGPAREGDSARILTQARILTPDTIQAAQNCAANFGGADQSSPIQAAALLTTE